MLSLGNLSLLNLAYRLVRMEYREDSSHLALLDRKRCVLRKPKPDLLTLRVESIIVDERDASEWAIRRRLAQGL